MSLRHPVVLSPRERRPIRCLISWITFRKLATNYRALLRKISYKGKASCEFSPPCTPRDRREAQKWLMLQLKPHHLLIGGFAILGTREHTHILTPYTVKVSRHTHQLSHTLRTKIRAPESIHTFSHPTHQRISKKSKKSIASWVESNFELDSREYSRKLKVTYT